MSVTNAGPVTTATVATPQGRVVIALARAEGRRLLRHPLLLLTGVLAPVLLLSRTWDLIPLLHTDDALVAESLLPFAFAVLLVVNAAVLRCLSIPDTLGSAPASRTTIATAHLLAGSAAAAAAIVIVVVDVAMLRFLGGYGSPNLWELLTGPLIVNAAGATGLALAVWLPWRAVAPVAAIGLLSLGLVTTGRGAGVLTRWLGPYVQPADILQIARELDPRPVAAHALYLVGLSAVAGTLALVRLVGRRRRIVALIIAASVLFGGVGMTATSLPELHDPDAAEVLVGQRVCNDEGSTAICLHPAYAPYRAVVTRLIDGIGDLLPKGVSGPETVVQELLPSLHHVSDPHARTGAIIGLRWGRGRAAGEYEFGLAYQLAIRAVGLPVGEFEFEPSAALRRRYERDFDYVLPSVQTTDSCYAIGEARAVLALWLAARATPKATEYLRDQARLHPVPPSVIGQGKDPAVLWCCDVYSPGGREPGARDLFPQSVFSGRRDLAYAAALLDVGQQRVLRSWQFWIDPRTTTREAVRSVGVPLLPSVRGILRRAGVADPDPGPPEPSGPWEPRCRDVEKAGA